MPRRSLVLVAHPDPAAGRAVARGLEAAGWRARLVSGTAALKSGLASAGLALADLSLARAAGLLPSRPDKARATRLLLLASPEERQEAATWMQRGADDLLILPAPAEEVRARVSRLLAPETAALPSPPLLASPDFVTRSAAMRRAAHLLERVAPARCTVLLRGESGSGKELFARAIHLLSPRRQGPWMPLNCSALPDTIIESELFGHEKGAFTGAVSLARGKFESAHGGTVFLDEVAEMSAATQAKLLRVLEERQVTRLGGHRAIPVDVRLLAATNADLERRVVEGSFREDLYHRLNVVTIHVPPLRERPADIQALAERALEEAARANGVPLRRLSPQVLDLFTRYAWPGNVRELKNLMESLLLTARGDPIGVRDLPARLRAARPGPVRAASGTLAAMELELIEQALDEVDGNRTRAARLLGIGVRTLQRRLGRSKLSGWREAGPRGVPPPRP